MRDGEPKLDRRVPGETEWAGVAEAIAEGPSPEEIEAALKRYEELWPKVQELLRDPGLLYQVKRVLDRVIVGEDENKLLLFLAMVSAKMGDPLHVRVVSDKPGAGKSHLILNVAKLIPEEMRFELGSLSPRALVHLTKAELKLWGKVLIFLEEDEAKGAYGVLKPLMSGDRKRVEHMVADKDKRGRLITKRIVIEGWPTVIAATTSKETEPEIANRTWVLSPDESEEQTKRIFRHQAEMKRYPWLKDLFEEEAELIRVAVAWLSDPGAYDGVMIPFDHLIEFPTNNSSFRRDRHKFERVIEASAFLHQYQRPILILYNEETQDVRKYIIATFADLYIAWRLTAPSLKPTLAGLHPTALKVFEAVRRLVERGVEVTSKTVADEAGLSEPTARKYLNILYSRGFLSRDESSKPYKYHLREELENTLVSDPNAILAAFDLEELKTWLDGHRSHARSPSRVEVVRIGQRMAWLKPELALTYGDEPLTPADKIIKLDDKQGLEELYKMIAAPVIDPITGETINFTPQVSKSSLSSPILRERARERSPTEPETGPSEGLNEQRNAPIASERKVDEHGPELYPFGGEDSQPEKTESVGVGEFEKFEADVKLEPSGREKPEDLAGRVKASSLASSGSACVAGPEGPEPGLDHAHEMVELIALADIPFELPGLDLRARKGERFRTYKWAAEMLVRKGWARHAPAEEAEGEPQERGASPEGIWGREPPGLRSLALPEPPPREPIEVWWPVRDESGQVVDWRVEKIREPSPDAVWPERSEGVEEAETAKAERPTLGEVLRTAKEALLARGREAPDGWVIDYLKAELGLSEQEARQYVEHFIETGELVRTPEGLLALPW